MQEVGDRPVWVTLIYDMIKMECLVVVGVGGGGQGRAALAIITTLYRHITCVVLIQRPHGRQF